LIASEYGYTINQFKQMTTREIQFSLDNIFKRKGEERKFKLSLFGYQVKDNNNIKKEKPFMTKEHKDAMIQSINKRFGECKNGRD